MVTKVIPPQWYSLPIGQTANLDHRLDASAYNVEALAAISKVRHYKDGFLPLWGKKGIICNAYYPGRYKRIYSNEQDGIPFYLPSQLEEIYPQPTNLLHFKPLRNLRMTISKQTYF